VHRRRPLARGPHARVQAPLGVRGGPGPADARRGRAALRRPGRTGRVRGGLVRGRGSSRPRRDRTLRLRRSVGVTAAVPSRAGPGPDPNPCRGPVAEEGGVIDDAFRYCEHITRAKAHNFYYGIRLLPQDKRGALSAVYAFARRVDDVADGAMPGEGKLERLVALRSA